MRVKELLQFIPDQELEMLAAESQVDYQVKKLTGKTMFQLILFSLLNSERVSLRVMEALFHSMQFRMVANTAGIETRYNSIRDRIATINPNYFEKIFHRVFDHFSKLLKEQDAIIRYDSTMIAVSSNLVEWGMKVGSKTNKVQLKYTMATKGSFPCHVEIFDHPQALCEDKTIPLAIFNDENSKNSILVFDRGVQKRKVFKKLSDTSRLFVTRIKTDVRYTSIKQLSFDSSATDSSVAIQSDLIVQLQDARSKRIKNHFRLIKATVKKSRKPIYFLTNITQLSPYEIAAIYKQRWEIEPFFKFLKQHLNLTHLVARNTNGIKVMIYMTMILAILLIAYKKFNHIPGYKISKLRFTLELEQEMMKQVVLLCDGNPDKMKHLFDDS
jgi:transposase